MVLTWSASKLTAQKHPRDRAEHKHDQERISGEPGAVQSPHAVRRWKGAQPISWQTSRFSPKWAINSTWTNQISSYHRMIRAEWLLIIT